MTLLRLGVPRHFRSPASVPAASTAPTRASPPSPRRAPRISRPVRRDGARGSRVRRRAERLEQCRRAARLTKLIQAVDLVEDAAEQQHDHVHSRSIRRRRSRSVTVGRVTPARPDVVRRPRHCPVSGAQPSARLAAADRLGGRHVSAACACSARRALFDSSCLPCCRPPPAGCRSPPAGRRSCGSRSGLGDGTCRPPSRLLGRGPEARLLRTACTRSQR